MLCLIIISKLQGRLTVMVADDVKKNEYNRVMTESNVDFCKATASILKSSVLIRSIFSTVFECFEPNKFKCPYLKVRTIDLNFLTVKNSLI